MNLAPIETSYAGHRMRSRLEARWAVVFDRLGLHWLYEPQGYTVGPEATPYLPDFYLPDLRLWAEVKGVLEQSELETLIWACSAAGLPLEPGQDRPGQQAFFPWRTRMLLLGEIPQPGTAWVHTALEARAGDLMVAQPVTFATSAGKATYVPIGGPSVLNQYVAGTTATTGALRAYLDGGPFSLLEQHPTIAAAYRAGRSARFEHGETPAAA